MSPFCSTESAPPRYETGGASAKRTLYTHRGPSYHEHPSYGWIGRSTHDHASESQRPRSKLRGITKFNRRKTMSEQKPGQFGWNELVSQDKDGSQKFYAELLGWTTEEMEMGPGATYTMFKQGEEPVARCIAAPPEAGDASTMWMNYIMVEDLDAAVAKASELGASICKERVELVSSAWPSSTGKRRASPAPKRSPCPAINSLLPTSPKWIRRGRG